MRDFFQQTQHTTLTAIIASMIAGLSLWIVRLITRNEISEMESRMFVCNMNASEFVTSTRRDVLLLYSSGDDPGLRLALKSLRSTGSQCRVILFISSGFPYTSEFKFFCKHLAIEVVPKCDVTKGREFVPHMLRFEYERDWIRANIRFIDRVFHSDALDVFFQGDPFSPLISRDKITFVVEPHCFRSCGWNFAWVIECYGRDVLESMRHNFIICSGSIAGGAEPYLKLLDLMISQPEWDKCWSSSKDQPILNYLVWKGFVTEAGIDYQFTGCDDGFFTMQWCILEKQVILNEHNQVVSRGGTVPSFLHQYNRATGFSDVLYKKCGLSKK